MQDGLLRTQEGSLILRRLMGIGIYANIADLTCEMSPIGLGAKGRGVSQAGGEVISPSISRLPPYAIVADAGVRLTASLWACRSRVMCSITETALQALDDACW